MSAGKGTRDGERLDVLVTLIEAYERKQQKGLTAKDLVPMIGQINRVYELLNGKRALTLQMIRRHRSSESQQNH